MMKELSPPQLENDELLLLLAKEKQEKNEISEEIKILYGQFDQLKNAIKSTQSQLSHTQKALENEAAEKKLLEEKFKKTQTSFEKIEKELFSIKQNLVRGLTEASELENRYLEAVEEKIATLNKLKRYQKELENLQALQEKQSLESKERFELASEELKEIRKQKETVEKELESLKEHCLLLENENEEFAEKLANYEIEMSSLKEDVDCYHTIAEESECQLSTAQQHLAKKVREVSELTEKNEELSQEAANLKSLLEETKMQNEQLKINAELQSSNELNLIREFQEKIESADVKMQKKEGERIYFEEQLQSSIKRIKELEALEEKHGQLQELLSGLGSVLKTPVEMTLFTQEAKTSKNSQAQNFEQTLQFGSPLPDLEDESTTKRLTSDSNAESPHPYQNLFEVPQLRLQPKETLFD